MLAVRHVLELVVRPALRALEPDIPRTEAAEHLLLGTAAVESGFGALRQYNGGPALGLWQMEPTTYRDLWSNWLEARCALKVRVLALGSKIGGDRPHETELAWNLRFAAAMARLHYRRYPEPLPAAFDVAGMARLWKLRYNTPLGAGKESDFLRAWERYVSPIL